MSDEDKKNPKDPHFNKKVQDNIARLIESDQYISIQSKIKDHMQSLVEDIKNNPGPPETHIVIVGGDDYPGFIAGLFRGALVRAATNYLKTVNFTENANIIVIAHSIPSRSRVEPNPSKVYLRHLKTLLKRKFKGRYYYDERNFDTKITTKDKKGKNVTTYKHKTLTPEMVKQIKGVVRSVVMFSHGSTKPYIAYNKLRKLGDIELDVFEKMKFDKDAFALFVACSCAPYAKQLFKKTGVTSIGPKRTWVYFEDTKVTKGVTAALGGGAELIVYRKGSPEKIEISKKMTRLWYVNKKTKKGSVKIPMWNPKKLHAVTLLQKLHRDGVKSFIGK